MTPLVGHIGRKSIRACNHLFNLFALTFRMLKLISKRPKAGRALAKRAIFEQIYFTCVQALPIIVPIALIVGTMLIIQFTKFSAVYDLGRTTVLLIVRELGPMITAFLVILRSATAVTIEIGYMNVLHEFESLEMAGVDPMLIICLPRLVGITSAVICLFIVFDLVSILGGYAVVWSMTYLPVDNFFQQIARAITSADIVVGIVKAVCFGFIITVTSLNHGFGIKRQITDIPVGTSKAAVESIIYCMVSSVIISAIFYL